MTSDLRAWMLLARLAAVSPLLRSLIDLGLGGSLTGWSNLTCSDLRDKKK